MIAAARLDLLPRFGKGGLLNCVIESPQGSRNKLKFDPKLGVFRMTDSLPAGSIFPFDFGFIPGTIGDDGDPIDVLVLMDAPVYPGCLVRARLLGVIEAEQTDKGRPAVRNDRLIAMSIESTERGRPRKLTDLDPMLLEEIETFFESYNALKGSKFRALRRRGPKSARRLIDKAAAKIDKTR